uniref:Uncharacterized protein LOC111105493 isoform X1 n=1 Tax=Crassostrea virginica TaxID=6565 RepID=A0A8B8AW84_CRAVI|nr:uncharacterized protein LOC111105493 isoform X1 [Crassostrea virginica]
MPKQQSLQHLSLPETFLNMRTISIATIQHSARVFKMWLNGRAFASHAGNWGSMPGRDRPKSLKQHFLCVAHFTRYLRNCICYHVKYEEREQLADPVKLLTVQRNMNAMYVAGHRMKIEDIRYYSPINYSLCTDQGKYPNVTIDLVYE